VTGLTNDSGIVFRYSYDVAEAKELRWLLLFFMCQHYWSLSKK